VTPTLVQSTKFINTRRLNSDLFRTKLCEKQPTYSGIRGRFLIVTGAGRLALLAGMALTLGACGGEGFAGPGAGTVTVSGVVSYEFVPANPVCAGLNFSAVETRPIRGATVQLLDSSSGTEIARTTASATGSYEFAGIPGNAMVRLRVRAELKDSDLPGWDVEVRDNFIAGASDADNPPPPAFGVFAGRRGVRHRQDRCDTQPDGYDGLGWRELLGPPGCCAVRDSGYRICGDAVRPHNRPECQFCAARYVLERQ
jgi:hypothetical protein